MRPQTSIDDASPRKAQSLAGSVRDLVHDVISLLELQWRLLQVDLRDGRTRLLRAAILFMAAPVIGLAALPLLFLGAAAAFSNVSNWPLEYVQMGLAVVLLASATLVGLFGIRTLSASMSTLTRSRNEFSENLAWFKSMLERDGREAELDMESHHFPHRFN